MLLYYDSRLTHTRGYYQPNSPFVPDATGRFYSEYRAPRGELVWNPDLVSGTDIDDSPLPGDPHTLDVRVAQAAAGPRRPSPRPASASSASAPAATSARPDGAGLR